jgi:hypothetical protein
VLHSDASRCPMAVLLHSHGAAPQPWPGRRCTNVGPISRSGRQSCRRTGGGSRGGRGRGAVGALIASPASHGRRPSMSLSPSPALLPLAPRIRVIPGPRRPACADSGGPGRLGRDSESIGSHALLLKRKPITVVSHHSSRRLRSCARWRSRVPSRRPFLFKGSLPLSLSPSLS